MGFEKIQGKNWLFLKKIQGKIVGKFAC